MEFFLGISLGYIAGHIINILPNFLLPPSNALWQDEFSKDYPEKKWVVFLYPVFFLVGLFGFADLGSKTWPYVHFVSDIAFSFYFIFWVVAGIGIASGVFEVLTGVSPLPQGSKPIKDTPFYFKAPWLHQYRYNRHLAWRARVIGGLRILLDSFFLFLFFVIGNLSLI